MEAIINEITSNKILLIIIILLISLLVYSILKQLVKIIVIIIIALALYLGYMNYKGDKTGSNIQEYLNKGEKELLEINKKKDELNRMLDSVDKITK
jgi:amino acid permease